MGSIKLEDLNNEPISFDLTEEDLRSVGTTVLKTQERRN